MDGAREQGRVVRLMEMQSENSAADGYLLPFTLLAIGGSPHSLLPTRRSFPKTDVPVRTHGALSDQPSRNASADSGWKRFRSAPRGWLGVRDGDGFVHVTAILLRGRSFKVGGEVVFIYIPPTTPILKVPGRTFGVRSKVRLSSASLDDDDIAERRSVQHTRVQTGEQRVVDAAILLITYLPG